MGRVPEFPNSSIGSSVRKESSPDGGIEDRRGFDDNWHAIQSLIAFIFRFNGMAGADLKILSTSPSARNQNLNCPFPFFQEVGVFLDVSETVCKFTN